MDVDCGLNGCRAWQPNENDTYNPKNIWRANLSHATTNCCKLPSAPQTFFAIMLF